MVVEDRKWRGHPFHRQLQVHVTSPRRGFIFRCQGPAHSGRRGRWPDDHARRSAGRKNLSRAPAVGTERRRIALRPRPASIGIIDIKAGPRLWQQTRTWSCRFWCRAAVTVCCGTIFLYAFGDLREFEPSPQLLIDASKLPAVSRPHVHHDKF